MYLMDPTSVGKRASIDDNGPPSKKVKGSPETPAQYSDAVRRKLVATSRTGQACDRCKERKMKCDTDPVACQPCRQKSLRCFTTDRVTGQARERGQLDRVDNELAYLREQVAAYRRRYGSMQQEYADSPVQPRAPNGILPHMVDKTIKHLPSARYTGWPYAETADGIPPNVMTGTIVDVMDGVIDVGAFPCENMEDYDATIINKFNLSTTSIFNTVCGNQRVRDENLFPSSKEVVLRDCRFYITVVLQYVPVTHGPSLEALVHKLYDEPSSVSLPEKVQVALVLAMMAHQAATRNQDKALERMQEAINYLHYALGYYTELIQDNSLAALQALSLLAVYFRTFPKPGLSWRFSHQILFRAVELHYHRDPDRIVLPPEQNNLLAKESRKRVFHTILTIAVTTCCRLNLPGIAPIRSCDCPLPMAVQDHEITAQGLADKRSGACDIWPAIHLSRLLPILLELQDHVVMRRSSPSEYVQIVDILSSKLNAWRQEWDDMIPPEHKHINLTVATLLIEQWAAEFMLILHHPLSCPPSLPDMFERNLDICHRSARKLLQSFHTLCSKYKGVDFTWHSTAIYAAALGLTIYVYRRRKPQTPEGLDAMKNEFNGWLQLVAYADVFLRTGNYLQGIFQPRIRALEEEYGVSSSSSSSSHHINNSSRSNSFAQSTDTPSAQIVKSESTAPMTPLSQGITPQAKTEDSTVSVSGQNQPFTSTSTNAPARPSTTTSSNPSQRAPSFQYRLPDTSTTTVPTYPIYPSPQQNQQNTISSTPLDPLLNTSSTPNWPTISTTTTTTTQNPVSAVTTEESVIAFSPHQYFASADFMWPDVSLPEGYQAGP